MGKYRYFTYKEEPCELIWRISPEGFTGFVSLLDEFPAWSTSCFSAEEIMTDSELIELTVSQVRERFQQVQMDEDASDEAWIERAAEEIQEENIPFELNKEEIAAIIRKHFEAKEH